MCNVWCVHTSLGMSAYLSEMTNGITAHQQHEALMIECQSQAKQSCSVQALDRRTHLPVIAHNSLDVNDIHDALAA